MRIRLTRKLSQILNGIDISGRSVGDVIDLPRHEAELLLAEGWALTVTGDDLDAEPRPVGGDAAQRAGKPRPVKRRGG